MALSLGPVRAHVRKHAEEISAFSGVTNVGGWRAVGSVPGSDHPKGLALDFMVENKAKGDQIAAYAIANEDRLDITYIIWYERWRQNGKDWEPYTHPSGSNDTLAHKDHVHLSFAATSSGIGGDPVLPGGIGDKITEGVGKLTPERVQDLVGGVTTLLGGAAAMAFVLTFAVLALIIYVWRKR